MKLDTTEEKGTFVERLLDMYVLDLCSLNLSLLQPSI